jgi:hypothetical protein
LIGLDSEGWILAGFAVLCVAALTVSVCGWLLLWRTRRTDDEPAAPPSEEELPILPPANPLR